jgi:hypothetical protein
MAGDENEAVRRRAEPIWSRIDAASTSFLLSLNDYTSDGRSEAIAAMTAALDTGEADYVVIDMRYLRGGDGLQLLPIVDAVKSNARINRPGGLTVLIGRENESAATLIAATLDLDTEATFVGEMTLPVPTTSCTCWIWPTRRYPLCRRCKPAWISPRGVCGVIVRGSC